MNLSCKQAESLGFRIANESLKYFPSSGLTLTAYVKRFIRSDKTLRQAMRDNPQLKPECFVSGIEAAVLQFLKRTTE